MKNLVNYFLLLLAVVGFQNCKDEGPVVDTGPSLPPITTEGKNTFGCLVNGELFIGTRGCESSFFPISNSYSHYKDSVFDLLADDCSKRWQIELGTIYYGIKTQLPLYNPNADDYGDITQFVDNKYLGGKTYWIFSDSSSELKILRDDDSIISGTFKFDAVNYETNDTIHITHGRFDVMKKNGP
ncbi:MAG: hypothetical protein GC181_08315 [Bacteroidetes bacterium]|nr:hypothetical protein [Bacteroidota bacterium]